MKRINAFFVLLVLAIVFGMFTSCPYESQQKLSRVIGKVYEVVDGENVPVEGADIEFYKKDGTPVVSAITRGEDKGYTFDTGLKFREAGEYLLIIRKKGYRLYREVYHVADESLGENIEGIFLLIRIKQK